jgi:lipopolysaccharide export system protein LptA
MIPSVLRKILVVSALLVLAGEARALPSDRDQPISYQADRAERDNQRGITILEGSVIMQRGSIRIEAERVVIEDENNKINLIIATGTPARYRQIPSEGAEPIIASARTIEYRLGEQTLHLIDKASLVQGGSSLTGNRIEYDVRQAVVTAGSDQLNKTERVHMIIPAKALQSSDDEDKQVDDPKSNNDTPQTGAE